MPIKRLDDLAIEGKVTFIKIDVEGMEYDVLKGGMRLIRRNMPYIMVESFETEFAYVKEQLTETGYICEKLDSADNWLFCPKEECREE